MTLEEYVKEVKGLVKQYEDGAITEAEMVNGIWHYSVKAASSDWYAESTTRVAHMQNLIS